MKKALFAAYIFFCTGGTYAQHRKDTVVAELNFNQPIDLRKHVVTGTVKIDTIYTIVYDTVRASLLITKGNMTMAHHMSGFVVTHWGNVINYLDDRMRPLKAPITVWNVKIEHIRP